MHLNVAGAVYNTVLNTFDMTEETRRTLKDSFDDLFEANNAAISVGNAIRALFFGLGGRIMYNALTEPQETTQELRSIMNHPEQIRDKMISDNFINAYFFRVWLQAAVRIVSATMLYAVGDATRNDHPRR